MVAFLCNFWRVKISTHRMVFLYGFLPICQVFYDFVVHPVFSIFLDACGFRLLPFYYSENIASPV